VFSDVSDIDDDDGEDSGSTSGSDAGFDDCDLMLHLLQQAQARGERVKFVRGLRKKKGNGEQF
jgi:hypothetical protein